ncbi:MULTISPECIES: tyrosinase family oxidase copper chaperone [Streptomyces]|uniref:Tyrosinase family oxidase copper chaperone n=2 Tax=Streptomyces TaxID=1883 RepID=A0ABV9IR68_9ACTN
MIADADGVPVPAAPAETARASSRRDTLRGLFGAAAGLVLVPVVAASWPPDDGQDGQDGQNGPVDSGFDEVYRGRHIQGAVAPGGRVATDGTAQWQVTVDGRPLHLMRRADGTWLSMVDHYRSYDTPLEAARAAVDELGPGEQLREPRPGHGGHTHTGGRHGLYA